MGVESFEILAKASVCSIVADFADERRRGMRFRRTPRVVVCWAAFLAGILPAGAGRAKHDHAASAGSSGRGRSGAGKSAASVHTAAGQTGEGNRPRPHSQHPGHDRIGLGHCFSLAAAGNARVGVALRAGCRRFRRHVGYRAGILYRFFLISTLAGLPLDLIGHHYERAYGISVQGWGKLVLGRNQSAGADSPVRGADSVALQLDCAALAAALLAGGLGDDSADSGVPHLYRASGCTALLQAGAARRRITRRWWRSSRRWWRGRESTSRRTACI